MRNPGSGRCAAWILAALLCALPGNALGEAGEPGESELPAGPAVVSKVKVKTIEPIPVDEQPTPIEPAPVDEQPTPIEPAPVDEQLTPIEPAPVDEQSTQIEPAPVDEQPTPIEPTPVDEQPNPLEPKRKDETERWVPAFAVFGGALVQRADAAVESDDTISYLKTTRSVSGQVPNQSLEVETSPETEPFDVNTVGDDLMVGPFIGGSLELMTPGLTPVPGRPRLFFHGDMAGYFGPDRDVARKGIPGEMVDPERPGVSEATIEGQGSSTSVEVKPLVFSAGAGIGFTVDAWGRRLRIKPSFEYLWEELEVSGIANQAYQTDTGVGASDPDNNTSWPEQNAEFILVSIKGSKKKTYHGIGPGLEVEMDAARAGPFMLTVFISGQAYKMLGDRRVTFTGTQIVVDDALLPAGEPQTFTADWTFEKDSWSYRGGVGLRFRWLPE